MYSFFLHKHQQKHNQKFFNAFLSVHSLQAVVKKTFRTAFPTKHITIKPGIPAL